uniref:Biogenesis of lysosome-related organelles complex 1 subunit 1 n=1 Tax=Aceria tosichella TaxID=561515 RepID=A0A6G1S6B6_9ACAR
MLAAMLKEHQRAQENLKVEINGKRAAAEKVIENLTAKNVKALNEDVSRAYLNQHRLDNETRKLKANVNKLTKQAQQWMIICNNLNGAVKDLGDINTWTKTIENDIQFISSAIGEAYKPLTDDK